MCSQVLNICRNGDTTLSGQPAACSNTCIVKWFFITFKWNFSLVHITMQPFLAILVHHFFTLPWQSCYTTLFTRSTSPLTKLLCPTSSALPTSPWCSREPHNDKSWISAGGVICTTRYLHAESVFFLLKSFPITGRVEDKTSLISCGFPWVYTGGTQHFIWVQWGLAGDLGGVQCEMAAAVGGWSSCFSFAWYEINHLRNPGKTVTEFGGLFFSYHFACWRESTAKQPMSIPIALEFSKAASSPSGTASCCLLWDLMKPGLQVVWLFLEMQH